MKYAFFFAIILVLSFVSGGNAFALQLGLVQDFSVSKDYDLLERTQIKAELVKETSQMYFYADTVWWNELSSSRKSEVSSSMASLAQEFERAIRPTLVSAFGSEWNPGIDGDPKIIVLLQEMKKGFVGYVRNEDSFLKFVFPGSNEREMIYFSAEQIESSLAKSFLAHEFVHLITINQKTKLRGVIEETWLDEARAEYAPTLLGYDTNFEGSNLKARLGDFLRNPSDSVLEWQGEQSDYGSISMFIHYLVDHYGVGVLIDSLRSDLVGIPSLNEALKKNGFDVDFRKVFTDWTIAAFLNDCSYGKTYCYLNQNLENFKLSPSLNFLPLVGKSTLQVTNSVKNWSPRWMKFLGGQGVLQFSVKGQPGQKFVVPYLAEKSEGGYTLDFLAFDGNKDAAVFLSDFGTQIRSLIIIPSLQTKTIGFEGNELSYLFSFTVSILDRTPQEEEALILQLLEQVDILKKEIARVQAQLYALTGSASCGAFDSNLYFGISNKGEVQCLQQFLRDLGQDVYPEGLTTGVFGQLTFNAVVRFQEKYASEILLPVGLQKGTGYVGSRTRSKINELRGF
ncbi:MAG: hypothetical protein HYS60_00560 [Candidatus Wildermuthbacteria bacterium]|nr:hypothetical protein [Candidatus Wildermuthbacteria bacterium]